VIYPVPDSMSLSQFCKDYNLSISQIWLWNELYDDSLVPGQEIFAYGYQDLTLEYKMTTTEMDLQISRLEYPVSLVDTLKTASPTTKDRLSKGILSAAAVLLP